MRRILTAAAIALALTATATTAQATPAGQSHEPTGIGVEAVDTCHDSDADDLRRATILYDTELEVFVLVAEMCDDIRERDWRGERFLWWEITTPDGDVYDLWAFNYEDEWLMYVERRHDEEVTFAFDAAVEDFAFLTLVPPSAFDGATEFEARIRVLDDEQRVDALPEDSEPGMLFPLDCSTTVFGHSIVTTTPGRYRAVETALGDRIVRRIPQLHAFEVVQSDDRMALLDELDGVSYVEPVAAVTRAAVTSSDPDADEQWALARVKAPAAWTQTTGSGSVIAVLDDGVDGTRPDLAGRVTAGYDTMAQQPIPAGADSDRGSHGTAVAGVAAADGDNGRDLAGIDWTARIAPFRVFDATGCSGTGAIASGIVRAVDGGADVINMSVGSMTDSQLLRDAVAYAVDHDVPIIAAVGNSGDEENQAFYPASYPDVIAVGASTKSDAIADYSVTGDAVDIVAPGGDGSGTASGDVLVLWERGSVEPIAGTSFAAPMVAGAVALYRGLYPTATIDDIREALTATAKDLGPRGRDDTSGAGLLDLAAFLDAGPVFPPASITHIAGASPTAMSIAASQAAFPDGTGRDGSVLIGSAGSYADALASARRQADQDAPLLLTGTASLDPAVRDEIARLNAENATILGGPGAVSAAVAAELAALGLTVTRISAGDRIGTAIKLAESAPAGDTAILVRAFGDSADPSRGFVDALAAGALAANRRWSILLTASDALTPATRDYLDASTATRVVVVGGTAAVSDNVLTELRSLGFEVDRVAGPGRAETAAAVAAMTASPSTTRTVLAVDGWKPDAWAFGFTLAAYAARHEATVTLTAGPDVPQPTVDYLATVGRPLSILAAGVEQSAIDGLRAAADTAR